MTSAERYGKLLERLRKSCAVLCGAGISRDSGLPTAPDFLRFVATFAPDQEAALLLERATNASTQRVAGLRFEGFLDVLQRTIDSSLIVLDSYREGEPICVHRATAALAKRSPILTTNFDVLIERAAQKDTWKGLGWQNIHVDEHDFPHDGATNGLWKLHGTLARFEGGDERLLPVTDPAFPVVTLKSLSASRESENKKTFLGTVVGAMPLVVVGYSGIDDFDISRWITQRPLGPEEQELPPTRELVWVQKVDDKTSGVDLPYVVRGWDIPADPYIIMESGLQNLITHWSKKGWLEHLTVVLHDLPAHLLVDLTSEVRCDAHRRHNPRPIKFPKLTDWDKYIVTGCLLTSLCRYSRSVTYLETAVDLAQTPQERAIALTWLAEAKIQIGDRDLRRSAAHDADVAVQEAESLSTRSLYYRARGIAALAKYLYDREEAAAEIETLGNLCKECLSLAEDDASLAEVGSDMLVQLMQQRRNVAIEAIEVVMATDDTSGDLTQQYVRKHGLLPVKASLLHEKARGELWQRSKVPQALDQSINVMKTAVELSRNLGDVRGLCRSLTLLGHFYLRQSDWPRDKATVEHEAEADAEKEYLEAYEMAEEYAVHWDKTQAAVSLAGFYCRRSKPDAERARHFLERAMEEGEAHDATDRFRIAFLRILGLFSAGDDIQRIAKQEAKEDFSALAQESRKGRINERMLMAAQINACACVVLTTTADHEREEAIKLMQELRDQLGQKSFYWRDRVNRLVEQAKRRDSKSWARDLIDPLPPGM